MRFKTEFKSLEQVSKTNLDNCKKITKNMRSKFECMIENHSKWK